MSDEERSGHGRRTTERGEESFPVDLGQPVQVAVGNPNGEVVVRGAERPDVLVRHVKHGVPGTAAYDGAELLIEAGGNRVAVRPVLPAGAGGTGGGFAFDAGSFAGFNPFKGGVRVEAGRVVAEARKAFAGAVGQGVWYDLEIEIPRSAAGTVVGVDTASGDVVVEAIAGGVRVRTASGDVRLRESRGEVGIDTASGDLAIVGASGPLRARTASGDVSVRAAEVPSLALQTASGDVRFEGVLGGTGPFRVETVSGDVQLGLGQPSPVAGGEPDLSLAFQTVSGDAQVAPPFRAAGRRTWHLGAGDGPKVAVKTVSGDLAAGLLVGEMAAPGGEGRAPAEPPVPPTPASPRSMADLPIPLSPPAPPVPPTPPAPQDPDLATVPLVPAESVLAGQGEAANGEGSESPPGERLAVLRAVERGEIDVEEALRRLDDGGDVGAR